jgi:hypothetical protein
VFQGSIRGSIGCAPKDHPRNLGFFLHDGGLTRPDKAQGRKLDPYPGQHVLSAGT